MSDTVNSVQPGEISKEMVAYLLTAAILGGAQHDKNVRSIPGIPMIFGFGKDEILQTYAECLRVVKHDAS